MPLTPLIQTLGKQRAAHLLKRTTFGGTPSLINEFSLLTAQEATQKLFNSELPNPEPPIDLATGTEWMYSGTTDLNSENFELEKYFLSWQIGQFLAPKVSDENTLSYIFRERMVLFFHTHFTTKRSVVGNNRALFFQNQLFRFFSFDKNMDDNLNFKDLVIKISIDNAMLKFLDGRLNVKGSPNENYARELLELYTVGRGLEGVEKDITETGDYGTFTEEDVQQGAKILSGFNVDETFSLIDEQTGLPTGIAKGNGLIAEQHENTTKQLSHRFQQATITPNTELLLNGEATFESALDEIKQFINIIFDQKETALHICRKIYRFFVYHEITEEIQNGVINDLAEIFIAQNYSIQAVLEALFSSVAFYEGNDSNQDDQFGSLIKSPVDIILGHARSFDLTLPDYIDNAADFYEVTAVWLGRMGNMGMNFYEPFEVAGYPAYHQYPIYHRGWITTTYLTQRYSYLQEMTSMDMENTLADFKSPKDFVSAYYSDEIASNAKALVSSIASHFLSYSDNISYENIEESPLTEARLNYFLDAFLKTFQIDENPEEAWTFRWIQGVDQETVERQLQDLFNAILQSPEYQLM